MDGRQVAAAVAARLRLDLVRDGLCDGYHAFSFLLPAKLSEISVLEAQELATGQVFGRILGRAGGDLDAWMTQTDAVFASVYDLHAALTAPAPGLPQSLAYAAAQFVPTPQRPPGLRLPVRQAPDFSLVVDAVTAATDILFWIQNVAPSLHATSAEFVIADRGNSLMSAALASLPGLSYCLTNAATRAERLNEAVARARGATVLVVEPIADASWSSIGQLPCACVSIGGAAALAAYRAGLADLPERPSSVFRGGITLACPRAIFASLDGLDLRMDDGAALAELDFALRARRAGYNFELLDRNVTFEPRPSHNAAEVREMFNFRWDNT
jgi:hypothetical protein